MVITEELVLRTRILLNEPDDTQFRDIDLITVLTTSESLNHALFLLWTQKASFAQKNMSDIKRISAGGESIERYTPSDYVSFCLQTAEGYKKAWENEKKAQSASRFVYAPKKPSLW